MHGHKRRLQRTCSPHFSHSYSCHRCSSVRRQNKSVSSGDWSRCSPQSYVKEVAVGLPLCKSQGWSLSDRGRTLPEDHWAWSTSAGRTSLSLIHNQQHQPFWSTHSANLETKWVRPTIIQTETAGVLKVAVNIGATSLSFPAVDKTSCCGIWNTTELQKVISLVIIEIPTKTCRQTPSR